MSKGYRPTPGRPPPPPPTVVSVELIEAPKPIAVSVDMPLKLDEGNENTEIKPEEVKESIEVPLRLEEESEEKGVEIGEMKNKQGPRGRVDVHTHRRPRPHLPDPADLRWNR
jgi:hypothetical protein